MPSIVAPASRLLVPGSDDDDAAQAQHLERKVTLDVHVLDLPVRDGHLLFIKMPRFILRGIVAEAKLIA